jgi:hypothetical protein
VSRCDTAATSDVIRAKKALPVRIERPFLLQRKAAATTGVLMLERASAVASALRGACDRRRRRPGQSRKPGQKG